MAAAASDRFDVAILGSGLAGTMTAAILAKHGFKVLVLEKMAHPHFAVGESMLPQATMGCWIIGERYGVPEIKHLARLDTICEHITKTCGNKRTISFLYHQPNRPQNLELSHLLIPPETPINAESHLFRQDVDMYMLKVAQQYGAQYKDHVDITDFDVGSTGVTLKSGSGETFLARYLIDCSGYRSPVAQKFGLRDDSKLKTRSRTLFTHMRGVAHYDDTLPADQRPVLSAGFHEGTLHHVFDGGWIWVIPFNNHGKATNELCSVGLTLDETKHPRSDLSPQAEFDQILSRYPSIARQFKDATVVRDWVSTGRLQYGSKSCVGERYFLMAHAYGFIDAMYSRGLINTMETINALAGRLMTALREDDFSVERFAFVDRLQATMLEGNDLMVHSSYIAFRDFGLWNAWIRIWLISKFFGDLRLFQACIRYSDSGDKSIFSHMEDDPLPGSSCASVPEVQSWVNQAAAYIGQVEAGTLTSEQATQKVYALLDKNPYLPPVYSWPDPTDRHLEFTPDKMMKTIKWGKMEAPAILRDRLFGFNPETIMRLMGAPPPSA
jgi:FADH2 O2-dependent halogenase